MFDFESRIKDYGRTTEESSIFFQEPTNRLPFKERDIDIILDF